MVSVEWALTMPVFLLVVLFCISGIFQSINVAVVDNAARAAARSYSLYADAEKAEEIVRANAGENARMQIDTNADTVKIAIKKPGMGIFRYVGINFYSAYQVVMEPAE